MARQRWTGACERERRKGAANRGPAQAPGSEPGAAVQKLVTTPAKRSKSTIVNWPLAANSGVQSGSWHK
jgi:hypothetical protein